MWSRANVFLSLFLLRLSTAYLIVALALLFSNFKFEKKSKVPKSFSDLLSLPFKALQLGAYSFPLNVVNVANTKMWVSQLAT